MADDREAPRPPHLSAIIPTHLRPQMLAEAIASVAAQSLPPSELIVVSDAGDAGTRELTEAVRSTLPFPLRYVVNEAEPGVCGSRNLGARVASGEWLAFLDDDDIWMPEFLRRCIETARERKATLVLATLLECSPERGNRLRSFPEGLDERTLFGSPGGMTGSNFVIARQRLLAVGGFDPEVCVFNDWDLLFRLVAADAHYAVVGEALVEWRQHGGERIGSRSLTRARGIDFFVDRYAPYMTSELIAELRATAASIRRRQSKGWAGYVVHSIGVARARGFRGALRKLRGARP